MSSNGEHSPGKSGRNAPNQPAADERKRLRHAASSSSDSSSDGECSSDNSSAHSPSRKAANTSNQRRHSSSPPRTSALNSGNAECPLGSGGGGVGLVADDAGSSSDQHDSDADAAPRASLRSTVVAMKPSTRHIERVSGGARDDTTHHELSRSSGSRHQLHSSDRRCSRSSSSDGDNSDAPGGGRQRDSRSAIDRRDGERSPQAPSYWTRDAQSESPPPATRRRRHDEGGAATDNSAARVAKASGANNKPAGGLSTRTGGAYIPPAKLRMLQEQISDKNSAEYQRLAWEALKKSLNGLINKVNVSNLAVLMRELLQENVVRGRGLLCRSLLTAQSASPTFTHVYAAFVAVVNSKFPDIGKLLLHRLVTQFKNSFRRNDKAVCAAACQFVAHLVNQQVAHEVLPLELLMLLLETASDASVELAVGLLQQVGHKLTELSPRGLDAIYERLRHVLHEAQLDKRVQYMIEVAFAVRKDGFKAYPSVIDELDVVEEDDQFTHMISLDDQLDTQQMLNVFRLDTDFVANEEKYAVIRRELLGDSDSSDSDAGDDADSDGQDDEDDADGEKDDTAPIIDSTETVLLSLRRTIYLTIRSSLDFEETAHKLLKLKLKPGQEPELCHMIIDCCAQERTFAKFYGLLAERFCKLNAKYQQPFELIFTDTYDTVHRLETTKLRNVAKLYGHLLHADAVNWTILAHVRLNETDTNPSSRIFVKILLQELSEFMGLPRLVARVNDPTMVMAFEGLFPRDNPKNTRFAINYFTSIGLGGLTDGLRDHLKSQPKPTAIVAPIVGAVPEQGSKRTAGKSSSDDDSSSTSSSSSSSDSSSSDSSSSSSSPSSDSSSESEPDDRRKKRKKSKSSKRRRKQTSRSSAHKKRPQFKKEVDSDENEDFSGKVTGGGKSRVGRVVESVVIKKERPCGDEQDKRKKGASEKSRDKVKKHRKHSERENGADQRRTHEEETRHKDGRHVRRDLNEDAAKRKDRDDSKQRKDEGREKSGREKKTSESGSKSDRHSSRKAREHEITDPKHGRGQLSPAHISRDEKLSRQAENNSKSKRKYDDGERETVDRGKDKMREGKASRSSEKRHKEHKRSRRTSPARI